MSRFTVQRRTLLRGAGGVALSLPALEIMGLGRANAAVPKRYVVLFAGSSLGGNVKITTGVPNNLVVPAAGGPLDATYAFSPFVDMKVQGDVGIVSGLKIPVGSAGALPPGGRTAAFHGSSAVPQLCGMSGSASSPGKGPSSDQLVADVIGADTSYKSVVLRVQVDSYRSTASIRGKMSFDKAGRPIEPKVDPKAAFDSLFSGLATTAPTAPTPVGGTTTPAPTAKTIEGAAIRRKSILDLVMGNTGRLMTRLGQDDRATMQRYLEELRDLERRIALNTAAPPPTAPVSAGPAGPGAVACNKLAAPEAIPSAGTGDAGNYSNEEKRAELLSDYVAAALACNRTRVATLQFTWVQCFMSMVPINGLKTDLHEAGHAAGGPKDVADGIKWHMKHFARLISRLKDTREVDGSSLLDNTALVFIFEGGHGYDAESGNKVSSHSSENMIALYAGRAGGLKPGKHIVAADKHPAQVVISAMKAVGVPGDKLGEVTGDIPEMFR